MTVREGGVRFIYRELDIENQFKGIGDYKGGIKARSLDSMNCVLRFFARIFGHTMEYKGKMYVVGDDSFRKFAIRNQCSTRKKFDPERAAKNIFHQYSQLSGKTATAFAQMKREAGLPPKISLKEADKITISKGDLEQVFNAIGVKAVDRDKITSKFTLGPKGYVITREKFLKALDKIEHKLRPNPPANLSPEMKKVSKEILEFLHHKIDANTVVKRTNQIFVGPEGPIPKPSPKPFLRPSLEPPPPAPSPRPSPKPTPKIPGGGGAMVVVPSLKIPFFKKGVLGLKEQLFPPFPKIKLNINFNDLREILVNQKEKTLALTAGPGVEIEPALNAIQKAQKPQVPQTMNNLKVIASSWVVLGRDVAKPVFDKLSLLDKAQVIFLASHHLISGSELLRNDLEHAVGQLVSHFVVANTLGTQQDDIANFLAFLAQVGDSKFKYGDEEITLRGDFFDRVNKYTEAQDNLLRLPPTEGEGSALYSPENRRDMLALSILLAAKEFGMDASQIEAGMSKEKSLVLQNQMKRLGQIRENAIKNVKDFLVECKEKTVEGRLLELCDSISSRDLIIALQQEPALRDKMLEKLSGVKALPMGEAVKLLEGASYEIIEPENQLEIFEVVQAIVEPKMLMAPSVVRAIGPAPEVREEGRVGKITLPKLQELNFHGDLRGQGQRLAGAHYWKNNRYKQDLRPEEAQGLLKRIIGQDDLMKIWPLYDAPSNDLKVQGKPPEHLRDRLGEKYPSVADLKAFLKDLAIQAKVPGAELLGKGMKLPDLNKLSQFNDPLGNSVRLAGANYWMSEEHNQALSQYDAERLLDKIFQKDRDNIGILYNQLGNEKEWKKLSSPGNMKDRLERQAPSADTLRSFLRELAVKAQVPGARDWGKAKGVARAALEAPRKEVQLPKVKDLSPYDSVFGQAHRLAGMHHWVNNIHKKPLHRDDARRLLEEVVLGKDLNKLKQLLKAPANELKMGGKLPEPLRDRFGERYPTATVLRDFLKETAERAGISLE